MIYKAAQQKAGLCASLAIHLLFDLEKLFRVPVFNFTIRKRTFPLCFQFKTALRKSDLLYLLEYYMEATVFLKIWRSCVQGTFQNLYFLEYILFFLSLSDHKMFVNLCSWSLFSKYAYISSDHKTPSCC